VSRGWGVNGNTHTLLVRGAGMPYYLVDFTRGVGFTNYRQVSGLDLRDIAFTSPASRAGSASPTPSTSGPGYCIGTTRRRCSWKMLASSRSP